MTEIKDPIIIGFDILPRSSPMAKKSPKYAMAILHGKQIDTIESLRRSEVFKKIRRYQPDIIATDNLLELGSSEKTVIDFLSKIPSVFRSISSMRYLLPIKTFPYPGNLPATPNPGIISKSCTSNNVSIFSP